MKKQRIVNKRLLRKIGEEPCCVCFARGPSDPCHIKTKGSGGPDRPYNLVPMCRAHHSEQHTLGILSMMKKYPMFRVALRVRGWFLRDDGRLWNKLLEPGADDSFDPETDKEGDE